MAVLQAANFTTLPSMVMGDSDAYDQGLAPVNLSMVGVE
jgi:hypothetical protein